MTAEVAVVVLTHDRAAELLRSLERLRALPERPRVVVVDNGSSDGTAALVAARHAEVEVIALPDNRGAAGRNAGVRRVEAPYVAFCDDDTWWAPGSLARGAALLARHHRLALLTGRVLVGREERLDRTCAAMARSPLPRAPDLPGPSVLGFLAAATMVRRDVFLAAGGFEPGFFLGGEEWLLAIDLARAGWGLAYVDDVVVHHAPSRRRDGAGRRALLVRNALWCAWMRRPLGTALRQTAAAVAAAPRDPAVVRGVLGALGGLGWALNRRRVVPPWLEAQLRRLDPPIAPLARGRRAPAAARLGAQVTPAVRPPSG